MFGISRNLSEFLKKTTLEVFEPHCRSKFGIEAEIEIENLTGTTDKSNVGSGVYPRSVTVALLNFISCSNSLGGLMSILLRTMNGAFSSGSESSISLCSASSLDSRLKKWYFLIEPQKPGFRSYQDFWQLCNLKQFSCSKDFRNLEA